MLVLCVGMYRACSTWQYGVVGELIERHRGGRRLGFADGGGFVAAVEPTLDHATWSVLKAHDAHERFAERLARGQALGIYAYRDLRDVAFSWMHKTGLTFEELVDRGFLEHCLRNDRFWRDQPGMLIQAYEDLIAEPARGVAEIAGHLGIEIDDDEAGAIADLLSFEANKKRTTDLSAKLEAEGIMLSSKDQDKYDRESLLHWNHVRDGRAGTWREVVTPEQEATLDRICGPWLVEQGYEADPTRPALAPALRKPQPPKETRPRITYAQNREDVLLDRLFRGKKGTYIDVGANHPTLNNSTYYFYLRGWRGVNVEPVRSAFDLFAEKRPADLNLPLAISDSEGTMPFYEVADCNGLSSLAPETVEAQTANGFRVVEREVSVRTVASLIEEYELVPPDFFSIDVEGSEEQVIRGIPLASWKPKVFVIEATRPMSNIPCHEAWEPMLLEHGYLFAAFDGINRFYLRGDLADALPLFDCPVNALDYYVPAETIEQRERAESQSRLADAFYHQLNEARAEMLEAKVELAHLKVRFGNELDARHQAHLGWLGEREAWEAERRSWDAERQASAAERAQIEATGQALRSELESTRLERDERDRQLLELEGIRAGLDGEIDHLHGVIGRLLGDVRDREAELDKTRLLLRPYLKLDRLGVVTALQKKVHAHRAHTRG